jgi:tetratricopeptide (TPR) repeat protein
LADLFDMQDEIVARLASQLGAQLITAEARRAERAPNPNSLDLYFQGMAWRAKGYSPEFLSQAGSYFERALALDPGNIEALVWRAYVDLQMASLYQTDDRATRYASAEADLTKALSLAPDHAFGHAALGAAQILTNRALQGIAECERALVLDRNLAVAHAGIGMAKFLIGRGEETEAHIQEALRLSPRDALAHHWMGIAGTAKLFIGSDDDAVTRFRHAIEINRNYSVAHIFQAVALVHLNRLDEARSEVQVGLALTPNFTMRRFRAGAFGDNPVYLAQRERVVEGLRKAGVPE